MDGRIADAVALSGTAWQLLKGSCICLAAGRKAYQKTVLQYDPRSDRWSELTPMSVPRAYAGAATVGNRIFVVAV